MGEKNLLIATFAALDSKWLDAASSSVDGHVVSHAVNMTINSF